MSGFDSHVNIENADAVEVSGFNNAVTETGCSDGKLTLSGYSNTLSVGGHCGGLTVSAYNNQVQVDSADTVDVLGYSNTVTYHSGSPKVTQSGYDIVVKQG